MAVLADIAQEDVKHCLLRDCADIEQLGRAADIDLLVRADELSAARRILQRHSFLPLPSAGYAPHHFFVSYLEEVDRWVKFDVVTRLAFGQPVPTIDTSLGDLCLQHRQSWGPTFRPSPEHELLVLLLHCTVDKASFPPRHRERLGQLAWQIRSNADAELLSSFWSPSMDWTELLTCLRQGTMESLLAQRRCVVRHLRANHSATSLVRVLARRVLRKCTRLAGLNQRAGMAVAVLAPDGAGKSTLIEGMRARFYFPVHSTYMGLYQKTGQAPRRWRIPGLGLLCRLARQWWRYLTARLHQARGRLVLFDRYCYDELVSRPQSVSKLQQLRRRLLGQLLPSPHLVVVLDAPAATLYARKREHDVQQLDDQRRAYLALAASHSRAEVVDATEPPDAVRRTVTALVWRAYLTRASLR